MARARAALSARARAPSAVNAARARAHTHTQHNAHTTHNHNTIQQSTQKAVHEARQPVEPADLALPYVHAERAAAREEKALRVSFFGGGGVGGVCV